MNLNRVGIVASAVALLISGGTLQGCGAEDLDLEDGLGKAEVGMDDCDGQYIAETCYSSDAKISVRFFAISATLTTTNVETGKPWDSWEGYELPDPVVRIELFDSESENYFGGTTSKYINEDVDSAEDHLVIDDDEFTIDLEEEPFQEVTMSGEGDLLSVPLSFLMDPESYLAVNDDDGLISEMLGTCAISPTAEELAAGVISAKNCILRNVIELKIGIKVQD